MFNNCYCTISFTLQQSIYNLLKPSININYNLSYIFLTNAYNNIHNNSLLFVLMLLNDIFFLLNLGRLWSRIQLNLSKWQLKRIDNHILSVTVLWWLLFFLPQETSLENNNKNLDGKLTWAFLLASLPSSVGNPKEALNHTRNHHHRVNIKTAFFIVNNFLLII